VWDVDVRVCVSVLVVIRFFFFLFIFFAMHFAAFYLLFHRLDVVACIHFALPPLHACACVSLSPFAIVCMCAFCIYACSNLFIVCIFVYIVYRTLNKLPLLLLLLLMMLLLQLQFFFDIFYWALAALSIGFQVFCGCLRTASPLHRCNFNYARTNN